MSDENKKVVKNQLFNASITGATFEEFSQNAVLFPVQDVPSTTTPTPVTTGSPLLPEYKGVETQEIPLYDPLQDQHNDSQFSSIVSSFSNILTFGDANSDLAPSNTQGVYEPSILSPTSTESVPLFPSTTNSIPNISAAKPPAPPEGQSANAYRRLGRKKVAYAQLPGLVTPRDNPVTNLPPLPTNQPTCTLPTPLQPTNYFQAPLNPIPKSHSSSILEEATDSTLSSVTFLNPSSSSILEPFTSPLSTMATLPPIDSSSTNKQTGSQPLPNIKSTQPYRPVYNHWFYKKEVEHKTLWQSFSMVDSLALEEAFTSSSLSPETVVPTDGARYDVNILRRERSPVYWSSTSTEVRRCSWFYKETTNARFLPYEENVATMLENEYRIAFESGEWHRKVELPSGDSVVLHGPDVLVLLPPPAVADAWGNTPQTQPRPRVIKRGMDEFDVDEGEPATVDHILFLVHGIGSVCDLKFRTVEEVVDEFRGISLQLIRSHYRSSCDRGHAGRVEVLPISWHSQLHSDETGIDKNLKNITLESIPRLRDFTNDTLLDILFYTSPVYCQTIITTVGSELNRIYDLFKQRNPMFTGGVSLGGHSLGSLICFDLLCHQHPEPVKQTFTETEGEDIVTPLKKPSPTERHLSRRISYMMSEAGTGQPQLQYPHLNFPLTAFFALGSPIGMFVTVRGLDKLGIDFSLPTCPLFFNIFHPYDPVAYRIESLVNPQFAGVKPVLIPHHKGRKRMHLELKETMTRVGTDIKQKLFDSMKNTWNSFFQMTTFGRQDQTPTLQAEVDRVFEEKLAEEQARQESSTNQHVEDQTANLNMGALNKGRRVDYVLQEAPFEFFNEYLFALTSHICYWESEDTVLMILKEIYDSVGIAPDNKVPQPTMVIEKQVPATSTMVASQQTGIFGMDPTAPMASQANVGPPPMHGFVKKT